MAPDPSHNLADIISGLELDPRTDKLIVDKCLNLCSLFNIDGDSLVNEWLAYAFNHKIESNVTLAKLSDLEAQLHCENASRLRQAASAPVASAKLHASTASLIHPTALPQTPSRDSQRPRPDSTPVSQRNAVLNTLLHPKQQKPNSFMSPTLFSSPAGAPGSYTNRTNKGRVIQELNGGCSDEMATDDSDSAIHSEPVSLSLNASCVGTPFLYMHQQKDVVPQIIESRVDALLQSIIDKEVAAGSTMDNDGDIQESDVKDIILDGGAAGDDVSSFTGTLCSLCTPSPTQVVCGGRILAMNAAEKLHASDTWLQNGPERVQITLPTHSEAEYTLFPGAVCLVRGFNPTGSRLIAQDIIVPSPLPRPSLPVSTLGLSLVVASGPFTFQGDLMFSALIDLLDVVIERTPDYLILCGPFVDLDNVTVPEQDPLEVRRELWTLITNRLQSVRTVVLTLPHVRESMHVACFPQPPFPDSSSKVRHLPNPCQFTLGPITLAASTHDIMFDLASNSILKTAPGSQQNRMSSLCAALISQRSFYPLLAPPPTASIDWTHLSKFALTQGPDLMLLPSTLAQFARVINDTVCVNPGRLLKGASSPGTYSRISIRPGDGPVSSRISADIVRI
uniref:DNA polymerase alpha subunit B n=1 Tax=Spongospora subterranea TaxID=70186 RepID=A0A0H5QLC9_9EUKA|eukprot:CRZ02798.1 hypothetical protein [Spongospora subterranea]